MNTPPEPRPPERQNKGDVLRRERRLSCLREADLSHLKGGRNPVKSYHSAIFRGSNSARI
jgi:hypothetical protein